MMTSVSNDVMKSTPGDNNNYNDGRYYVSIYTQFNMIFFSHHQQQQ